MTPHTDAAFWADMVARLRNSRAPAPADASAMDWRTDMPADELHYALPSSLKTDLIIALAQARSWLVTLKFAGPQVEAIDAARKKLDAVQYMHEHGTLADAISDLQDRAVSEDAPGEACRLLSLAYRVVEMDAAEKEEESSYRGMREARRERAAYHRSAL
jgi:hypothetical protein